MSQPMRWEEVVPSPLSIPDQTPNRRRKTTPATRILCAMVFLLSIFSILGLAGVGAVTVVHSFTATPDLNLVMDSVPQKQVALGSVTVQRKLGYVTIAGSVSNQIKVPLQDVQAVVELLDSQNRTLTMESALIAFRLLPSKQTAPFRVEVPDDAHAVGYRLRFTKLDGSALD